MTGALQRALSLLRGLMEKYPEESDEQIGRRFQQDIKNDPVFQYSIYKDVYRDLFLELRATLPRESQQNTGPCDHL
jgi:hypothetical protein